MRERACWVVVIGAIVGGRSGREGIVERRGRGGGEGRDVLVEQVAG